MTRAQCEELVQDPQADCTQTLPVTIIIPLLVLYARSKCLKILHKFLANSADCLRLAPHTTQTLPPAIYPVRLYGTFSEKITIAFNELCVNPYLPDIYSPSCLRRPIDDETYICDRYIPFKLGKNVLVCCCLSNREHVAFRMPSASFPQISLAFDYYTRIFQSPSTLTFSLIPGHSHTP